MSILADKIKRACRLEGAPIGFGVATERHPIPTMLSLLRLDKNELKKAGDAIREADAVIITGVTVGELAKVLKALGDVPAGLRLDGANQATVSAAREAGADFVLIDENSPAESILEESAGLVLRIGGGSTDAELRALAGLPLDALEIPPIGEPFTVRRLMELRRLSLLVQTPLFVDVAPDVEPSRLETLRGAGVAGVILDEKSAGKLGALREAILSLPPRGRRREDRSEALLPSLAGVPGDEVEEPDLE